jgi:hypothetical protein
MEADQDGDGKLSFEEFAMMVANTVRFSRDNDCVGLNFVGCVAGHCEADDARRSFLTWSTSLSSLWSSCLYTCLFCICISVIRTPTVSYQTIHLETALALKAVSLRPSLTYQG